MVIEKEYKNKIYLKEKVRNFKVNILRILTLPARKKFFLTNILRTNCGQILLYLS